jgi:hypothetical protein
MSRSPYYSTVYRHRDIDRDEHYDALYLTQLTENVVALSRYMQCGNVRLQLTRKQALDLADALYFVCRPEDDIDPTEVPF